MVAVSFIVCSLSDSATANISLEVVFMKRC